MGLALARATNAISQAGNALVRSPVGAGVGAFAATAGLTTGAALAWSATYDEKFPSARPAPPSEAKVAGTVVPSAALGLGATTLAVGLGKANLATASAGATLGTITGALLLSGMVEKAMANRAS